MSVERMTKQQLIAAYTKAQEKLANLDAGKLDIKGQLARKVADDAIALTESMTPQSIDEKIGLLRSTTVTNLDNLRRQLEDAHHNLMAASEAVRAKRNELQDLYGIEAKAESLAALVEAHREWKVAAGEEKEKHDRELAEEREAYLLREKEDIEGMRREIQETKDRAERTERQRAELAQWKFEKEERDRRDTLQQALQGERRSFEAWRDKEADSLQAQKEEVGKREAKMSELEATVAELRSDLELAGKEREEAIEAALKRSMEQGTARMHAALHSQKVELEAKLSISEERGALRMAQLEESHRRVDQLEMQLAAAHAKINEVAMKTLDTSHANAAMMKFEKFATDAAATAKRGNGS